MSYVTDLQKYIKNNLLSKVNNIFTIDDFCKIEGYENKLNTAELIADIIIQYQLIEQIARVTLPSGEIKDYKSILDIPDNIFDISAGKTHTVVMNDVSILYKKLY